MIKRLKIYEQSEMKNELQFSNVALKTKAFAHFVFQNWDKIEILEVVHTTF